ncbi:MAG: type II secretion system protein GspN, partial [Nitrospinota bacterium]
QKLSDPKSFALAGNIDIAGFLKIPKKTLGENHFDVDSVHTAEFNLNLEKIGISLPKLPVKKLSSFAFDTINGALSMERGLVKVNLGKISGDVNGSLKGKITVMNPVLQSRLDIRSKFKPTEALVTRAAAFLSILNRKKSAGGVYTLDIKGTFLNPRPII